MGATAVAAAPAGLSLAMERVTNQPGRETSAAQRPARRQEAAAQKARITVDKPLGLGYVLLLLFMGSAIFMGGVVYAVQLEIAPIPQPVPAPSDRALPDPDPALAEAIAIYEAGKHGAAVARLRKLAGKLDDPRVHKYLALALHKSKRTEEARAALSEYRRNMQQAGGDGRQVREVRD